jgi:hypothetical protein
VEMTSSWGLAVWPERLDEPAPCCSPRSRPAGAVLQRASVQRVPVQRVPLSWAAGRRASAHAPVRAGAVGPVSRAEGAARQRWALLESERARAVLQPRSAQAVSQALSQE